MRKIKDGAGAGYTIQSELTNFQINSVKLVDVDTKYYVLSCEF